MMVLSLLRAPRFLEVPLLDATLPTMLTSPNVIFMTALEKQAQVLGLGQRLAW